MTETQLVLRCPHCDEWTFVASPPDSWHSAFSFDEPIMSSYHGDIKTQTIVCKNRDCRKTIVIYWYAPMEYFDRM